MITDEQLEIIKSIQKLQDDLITGLDDKLPLIFKDLSDQVIAIADTLDFDPKKRVDNLQKLRSLKSQILKTITENVAYQEGVKEVLNGFKELKKLSDSYYSVLIDGYSAKSELYAQILASNIEITQDLLLGAGIRENFSNAISEVLKENIAGNTSRTNLNKVLRDFIKGSDTEKAYLNRYVKSTVNDSVMTFSREYNQVVSDDLNLQYYTYVGTRRQSSRPWCIARKGRYFKKSEVLSWVSQNWDGKIESTNKNTIFSYCGGWGCVDEFYPITKSQYVAAEKKGLAGLR